MHVVVRGARQTPLFSVPTLPTVCLVVQFHQRLASHLHRKHAAASLQEQFQDHCEKNDAGQVGHTNLDSLREVMPLSVVDP